LDEGGGGHVWSVLKPAHQNPTSAESVLLSSGTSVGAVI
jgi:hypothetical protein